MVRQALLQTLHSRLGKPLGETDVAPGLAAVISAVQETKRLPATTPILIGIAGGSGSGKTSQVAQGIARAFPDETTVIAMDNYYRGAAALATFDRVVSWDEPAAIEIDLLAKQLNQLRQGEMVDMPVYDFTVGERLGYRPLRSNRIIIVEGLFTLVPELVDLFDLRLYVSVDVHGQVIRRLLRDLTRTKQAPKDILRYMAETAIPMHQRFVETLRPQADLVLVNDYRPETESAKRRFAGLQLKKRGWPEPVRLEELGAEYLGCLHQMDTYLDSPAESLWAHGEILRLRREGSRITLTYKGPPVGDQGERFVFTCSLDDRTARGLQQLYLLRQTVVRKERSMYVLDGIVVQLDQVTISCGDSPPVISDQLVTELRLLSNREDNRTALDTMFHQLGLLSHATQASYEHLARQPEWFTSSR